MKIGPYELENKVMLAPMAGITDWPFRKVCKQMGAGWVVGEMSASIESVRQTSKSKLRAINLEEPDPRVVQIVGYCPEMMAQAAEYYVSLGACVIDINMGCPAKKVCKRLAGSALLSDLSLVSSILEAVVSHVNVPVTLKIRTGINLDQKNAVEVAKIAQLSGVAALVIHGRTRACLFKGKAEYDTIRKVKKAVSIPVVANGDINTIYDAKRVLAYTGVDAIMVGRAVQGKPWLLGQIAQYIHSGDVVAAPEISIQKDLVLTHLSDIYQHYGKALGVRIARKHIKWYMSQFESAGASIKDVVRLDCAKAQYQQVEAFYSARA